MATWPDPRSVIVSMAFGNTLRDTSPTWEVLSPGGDDGDPGPVLGPVMWERGRLGDAPETAPTKITLALRDDDGEFSRRNASSPRYGTLREGTPVRLSIDFGAGPVVVATAGALGFSPVWDGEDDDGDTINPRVPITALGLLSQISRDTEVRSAARLTLPQSGATSLWLLESSLDSALPGGAALDGDYVSTAGPLGTTGAMDMSGSVTLSGALAIGPGGSSWRFGFAFKLSTVTGTVPVLVLSKDGLPYLTFSVRDTPGSEILIDIELGVTSDTATFSAAGLDDGEWHTVQLVGISDGGGLLDLFVSIDGTDDEDSGITVDHESPDEFAFSAAELVGLSAITNFWIFGLHLTLTLGLAVQSATSRFETILTALGLIDLADTGSGDTDPPMGRLEPSTAMEALRATEDVTEGAMFENGDGTIALQLLDTRYNQTPAATFAWADLPGSPPIDNDRDTYNIITATDLDGNFAVEEESTGPVGSDPTTGIGPRPLPITRNLNDPADLRHHAGWVLRKGTVDQPRYIVYLDLYANPDLTADYAAIGIGSRVTVDGAPTRHVGPDALDLIVEGIRGSVMGGDEGWVELHCQPYPPYNVRELNTDSDPDANVFAGRWAEEDGTALDEAIDSTAPSFDVDPNGGTWTTDDDEFDTGLGVGLFVEVGGEVMQVTDIADAGAGIYTFTVTRSLNGVEKAHSSGAPLKVVDALIWAL